MIGLQPSTNYHYASAAASGGGSEDDANNKVKLVTGLSALLHIGLILTLYLSMRFLVSYSSSECPLPP